MSTAPTPSPTLTSPPAIASASPTALPSATASVLDDRFGFVLQDRGAVVRSETSDAVVATYEPSQRSFASLSRYISPDGRSVAYWQPANNASVLYVRAASGGNPRAVFTTPPDMSGNAFAWSSDGSGIVAAIDNNCQEICAVQGSHPQNELWTIDLANAATERIASNVVGKIWLPITWDRAHKVVAAGVTGPGGYLIGYDVVDLATHAVRSTDFRPTVLGRLKASSDDRYVLLTVDQGGTSTKLSWWPLAEPEKRTDVAFDGVAAEWRPGTSEIWWTSGLVPAGCRTPPCAASDVVAFDVASGTRRNVFHGTVGWLLVGFRADGSAAITELFGTVSALVLVDTRTAATASVPVSVPSAASVRLR